MPSAPAEQEQKKPRKYTKSKKQNNPEEAKPKDNVKTAKNKQTKNETQAKAKRKRKSKAAENPENNSDQNNVSDKNVETISNNETLETNGKITVKRTHAQLGSQSKKEDICSICDLPENLIACTKGCCSFFHKDCLKINLPKDLTKFECDLCKENKLKCFICSKTSDQVEEGLGQLKRCTVQNCGKSYHSTCLEIHMTKFGDCVEKKSVSSTTQFRCPLHFCETCTIKSNTSLKNAKALARSKYFKCVRCPTSYHVGDDCIGAGSSILAGLNIICPKHFKPTRCLPYHHPVHVSWCFICSQGGKLVCCASCPAAFHVECMAMEKEPEGDFFCRDCSNGIRPLYGDLVWIKLGTYRWWPGEVVHPLEVPDNIMRLRHDTGEFVVQFLGSRDFFWLNRCRVFLYQDGDASGTSTTTKQCSKGISTIFKKALAEAEQLHNEKIEIKIKQEIAKSVQNDKKPAPYKHIRVNRPVGKVQIYTADIKEIPRCSCKPSDPSPCSADSECLNHMLLYECHPDLCPAAERCENQRFQKCLYPKFDVFKTSWGGWGLKTLESIKKGQFVNEYVGELVDEEECKKRIEKSHENDVTNYYMLTIDKDRIIDAGPKGNYSRFMNHSCDPNCETQKWTVNGDTRVGLFAKLDIEPGTELTFNYNLDCLGNDKTTCKCGAKNCSGYIGERPKPQLKNGERKEVSKKRKRVKRTDSIPQHEDLCFRCRNTGLLLVCCDFKDCLKAYCLSCLNITKPPYGKWECPWHHCDWCGRKAQYHCHFCPNSFCSSHIPNQLRPSVPNRFDCCLDHNPETAEFELTEAMSLAYELNGFDMPEEPAAAPVHEELEINGKNAETSTQKKRKRAPTNGNKNKSMARSIKISSENETKSTPKRKRATKKEKLAADNVVADQHIEADKPQQKEPTRKRKRASKAAEENGVDAKPKRAYKKRKSLVVDKSSDNMETDDQKPATESATEDPQSVVESTLVIPHGSGKLMASGINVLARVSNMDDIDTDGKGAINGLAGVLQNGCIKEKFGANLLIDQNRAEISVQAVKTANGDQPIVTSNDAMKKSIKKLPAEIPENRDSVLPSTDEKIAEEVVNFCVDKIVG